MLQLFLTKNSFLVYIFGQWSEVDMHPIGGIAYFLSPPERWYQIPRLLTFGAFVLASCADCARFWVRLSGQSARDMKSKLLQ